MVQSFKELIETVLAMGGILLRRLTAVRVVAIVASFAVYQFYLLPRSNAIWAGVYFGFTGVIHYVLLFGIFARNREKSWAQRLINRFGEKRAFEIFEGLMAFVFLQNGLGTAYACTVQGGLEMVPSVLWFPIGLVLAAFGFGTKLWATRIVTIDTYYYKDLFIRRPVIDFTVAGPYKFLKNPMYGVGHLHAYGLAVVSGSLFGLAAVALNQACIWAFYLLIEKPHVREMYGDELAEPMAVP